MKNSDPYVLFLVQTAILLFTIFAGFRDLKIRKREQNAQVGAEIERGKNSMAAIYTVYGAIMASCLVVIDRAVGLEGNKVVLIVLDFLCVTYVFFFNTWFRNALFSPLMRRVRKD
jgi:hypothetical protein